jgi:hypothetical protein
MWPLLAWIAVAASVGDEQSLHAQDVASAVADLPSEADSPEIDRLLASDESLDVSYDPAIRRGTYVARHPNPNEPLGFEGARFSPGAPVDPSLNSGILVDDPIEEFYDPMDPDAPAPTVSSGEWIRNGCWYTQQSVVYMNRNVSPKNEIRLAIDLSSAILPAFMDRLDIAPNMGYEPGLRSTIGRFLGRDPRNRDHALEFTFLGLTHWQDGDSLTAQEPGAIISTIDPTNNIPGFNGSDFQSYFQSSNFSSYELNYRVNRRLPRDQMIYTRDSTWVRRCARSPLPSIFGGLRVVSIAETLHYVGNSSTALSTYDIATHNKMVGLQAGAEWFYEHYEWRLGGRLKAASFVNWSDQSSRLRIVDPSGAPLVPDRDRDAFADVHNLAFLGEISFIGAYQFTPNFAFRSSYDLMWVTNLALAQNQITFIPRTPTEISTLHALFYQGFSFGLEWVH